ncbi:DUF3043 domain-containing protein [Nocardioides jishulii]|uniref:DUF3043 domain-containing protein n=1 Tax=Nocardioides jishulii TaxID=2575440 RepID=A0A4U2YK73_9ACTN|nr:DUF3043 domain-containing protein [Nocardioides jishulii]QCX27103.1 DUF3043 domain-containing protein [Nocardioides jishulii]TKI61587.1 DUF3043 domain-containing protein [Nocardioides jishulii]
MFRRNQPAPSAPETTAPPKPGGKGRPTPSRKEAEAAARARAKTPRTRKEMAAAQRAARAESTQRTREALKTGDERFLPARDRGPVRRFIRDYVDVRFSFIELLIPIMVISLILGWTGNAYLMNLSEVVLLGAMVFIVMDMVWLRMRLRRELTQRFPGEPLKGTTYYAVMRAMQMKFMRLPKPTRKIGEQLPDTYR